jgi:hypothetical protein
MKRIHAWRESDPGHPVKVYGGTLASAVRKAARALGLGPGKTDAKERLSAGEWRWTWSGIVLRVHEVQPSGESIGRGERKTRKVELSLPADVHKTLDELAPRYGSRSAVVVAWARAAMSGSGERT